MKIGSALLLLGCPLVLGLLEACSLPSEDVTGESAAAALTLGARPPMGWNSWNTFGCRISEQVVRRQADVMVASGMNALGYEYVNLDDCWMDRARDAAGNLRADPRTFPSGIKALADYVHARGLKLGIYESPGYQTCVGRGLLGTFDTDHPGSEGHETQDAAQFAAWGVDYLKYDRCTLPKEEAEAAFETMRVALAQTGRPIFYSINPDGAASVRPWSAYANMWRTTKDINPTWTRRPWIEGNSSLGIADILDVNEPLAAAARPGSWNDPDMLEVGAVKNYLGFDLRVSDEEGRTQFSMWAIMAAPLIAGNDLTTMSTATRETLTNAEVIAVDQDAAGIQGRRVQDDGDLEVWSRPLTSGERAVALLNRSGRTATVRADWMKIGLAAPARVRDLWAHADRGMHATAYAASVPSHGVVLLKITP